MPAPGVTGDILRVELHGAGVARLPGLVEITAYHIVQEAMTNAVRHGGAETISVSIPL